MYGLDRLLFDKTSLDTLLVFLSAFSKPGAGLFQALGAEGMATEKKQAEFEPANR